MAPAALVFDLDGTLWDSRIFYAKAISLVSGDFNGAMECLTRGVPVARLLREEGIAAPGFRKFVAQAKDELCLYASVQDVLSAQKDKSVPMGIVTSLPGWIAIPMLESSNLSQFFATVVGWNRCRIAKPSPKPILLALDDMQVSPSKNVWYVGDSVVDSQAARAASISFAWASYGYSHNTYIEADLTLKSFDEVLAL